MVCLGAWQGKSLTVTVRPNCLTIGLGGPAQADVLSYDGEGRLWTAMLDSVAYRRGLDGKVIARWEGPGRTHDRRWLADAEARRLEAQAQRTAAELWQALRAGSASLSEPLPAAGWQALEQAAAFDAGRVAADMAAYRRIYRPVGILPPDQYMAVVLQATEGCSFNRCTFCSFYKDRPFRAKAPDEFLTHARAVRDFLGRGLSLRRTIFLGDANALVLPMAQLRPLFQAVHEVYDVQQLGGIYAFLDGFSAERKIAADYGALAGLGLRRVYVGLESGHAPLARFLNKPGQPAEVIRAVQAMKAGGVAVGVMVLLGAGGHEYAAPHVADTIRVLNALALGLDDLVYFSELVAGEDVPYTQAAYAAHLRPLSPAERQAQGEAIEAGLKFSPAGGTPHISRYDVREFVY
jgi:hypothetical protein